MMSGRVQTGILLIVIGLGFALQQTGLIDFTRVLVDWWPVIFIVIGIIQIVNHTFSTPVSGIIFILVGGILLANNWLDINIWAFIWPVILIGVGLTFIFSRPRFDKNINVEDKLNVKTFFSGTELRSRSEHFQGGTISTIFGGAEIDLRDAVFDPSGAQLEITSVFGGVEIKVPENVHVEISGTPVFGGWEDVTRRKNKEGNIIILKIHAILVFSGVEIKD